MNRIFPILLGLCIFSFPANADEWIVTTLSAGNVKVCCPDPGNWNFDVSTNRENNKDVITVNLTSDSPATPPAFSVELLLPQLDVHHLWRPGEMDRCQLRPDWQAYFSSNLAFDMPLYAFISDNNDNRLTVASSEPLHKIDAQFGLMEEGCRLIGKLNYFNGPQAPASSYQTKVLLDNRRLFWGDAVREAAEWMTTEAGIQPVFSPDAAFDPLYSTWYNFHQNVSAEAIERECARASKAGMKTIILDDGWQTDDNNRGYAFCGDWEVSTNRFADFAAHVRRIHDMGMKYMVWYSVPYMGKKSRNYKRFMGKYLREEGDAAVLDPRFPEVREFLCSTYENAMLDYKLDGFKLDFIDSFAFGGEDPAVAEDYAGRDIKSLPEAVNLLMKEIYRRLSSIKPEVLIEFRQRYIGPAIRQYGNMLRAGDCPADMQANRQRIANLRLTSGKTAVHADMLEWNHAESPENAARHILSALFGVVQYSLMLEDIPESHHKVIEHWLDFSQKHRNTLLKSDFRPYHPEACYPIIEAESDDELIVAVYNDVSHHVIKPTGKDTYVINATGASSLVLDIARTPTMVESYNVYGERITAPAIKEGVQRIAIPPSGYIHIK